MNGLSSGDALLIFILGVSLLAGLAHVEKAINRQSDLLAHAIVLGASQQ